MKKYLLIVVYIISLSAFANPSIKVFDDADCKKFGIPYQKFNDGSRLYPRYDGLNYFIDAEGMRPQNPDLKNHSKGGLEIQGIIDKAVGNGSVVSVSNLQSFFNGNSGINFNALPLVLQITDSQYEYLNSYLVVTSLVFKKNKTEAEIAWMTKSSIKNSNGEDEKIYLGAILDLGKGGEIKGTLKMIAPKEIKLFDLQDKAVLNISAGTGVCLGCDDKKYGLALKLVLAGSLDFNPSIAVAVKANGEEETGDNRVPKLHFAVMVTNWSDVYIQLALPLSYGIKFRQVGNLSFWNRTQASEIQVPTNAQICGFSPASAASNIVLDLSSTRGEVITTDGPCSRTIEDSWKGILFKNMDVSFPKGFREPNNVGQNGLRLALDYLFFDETGLNAKAGIGTQKGKYYKLGDGFDIRLNEALVEVYRNKLTGFELGGDFRFPYLSKGDFDSFSFNLGFSGNCNSGETQSGEVLTLKIEDKREKTDFGILGAKFTRCTAGQGVSLETTIENWQFDNIQFSIRGIIHFGEEMAESDGDSKKTKDILEGSGNPIFNVKELTVTNKAPFITALNFSLTKGTTPCQTGGEIEQDTCSSNLMKLAGFNIMIQQFSMSGDPTTGLITGGTNISLTLGKSCQEGKTERPLIKGSSELFFKASYSSDENERYAFKFTDVSVKEIAVNASLKTFSFDGHVRLFKNEPAFGENDVSGFKGRANLTLKLLGKDATADSTAAGDASGVGAGVALMFLTVNKGQPNEYKAWAVDANVSFGTGIPIGPVMLKGVFGGAYKGAEAMNVGSKVLGSKTGIEYQLKQGHWGFNFGMDLGFSKVDLTAMLAAEGGTKGLKYIKGLAYAKFEVEGPQDKLKSIGNKVTSNFGPLKNAVNRIKAEISTEQTAAGSDAKVEFTKGETAPRTNKIGAGTIITLNFGNGDADEGAGYFEMIMYPDIQITLGQNNSGANLRVEGFGKMFISDEKKYVHIGKQNLNDRIRLTFNATLGNALSIRALVTSYFMLGDGLDKKLPDPIVPQDFLSRFKAIEAKNNLKRKQIAASEYDSIEEGRGFATGFSVGVEVAFKAAKVLNADILAGAGFDALLLVKPGCGEGWTSGEGGTWRGTGQIYGYAEGGIRMFGVNLAKVGMGFLLRASMPQPFYADGTFLVYAQIWKAKVNFNVNATIGTSNSTDDCLESPEAPHVTKNVEMIVDLSPSNPKKLSKIGNLYVDLKLGTDQTVLNTIQGANDKVRLGISVSMVPKSGGVAITKTVLDLPAEISVNGNVKVPLGDIIGGNNPLVVGEEYEVTVKSWIYVKSNTSLTVPYIVFDDPNQKDREEISQSYNDIMQIEVDDNTTLRLFDEKKFKVTVDNSLLLDERDIMLYPAKDMLNVYVNDYNGRGYMQIDPSVRSALSMGPCLIGNCNYKLGIYKNGQIEGTAFALTAADLAGYDFNISNLLQNQTYEMRLWIEKDGIPTPDVLYKSHFFKTDEYYKSFSEKIQDVNENNEAVFSSSDASFLISATDAPGVFESFFSAEELEQLLTMRLQSHTWFEDFDQAFQVLTSSHLDNNGELVRFGLGQSLNFDIQSPEHLNFKIGQSGYLDNGVFKAIPSKDNVLYPTWEYTPFSPAIYEFYTYTKDNLGGMSMLDFSCAQNPSNTDHGCGCIPCFSTGEYCILIDHDIKKLDYYTTRNSMALPSRFDVFEEQVCFENKAPRNFNISGDFTKVINITCTSDPYDYGQINFTFEMENTSGNAINFPEGFVIEHSSSKIVPEGREEFTILEASPQLKAYSRLLSSDGCPANETGFTFRDGLSSHTIASRYTVNYSVAEIEEIKPCATILDMTDNSTYDNCNNITVNAPDNQPVPEVVSGLCSEFSGYSAAKSYFIQLWATPESKGVKSQKVRKNPMIVEIWDGTTVLKTQTIAVGASSIVVTIDNPSNRPLTLKVSENSDYQCGDSFNPALAPRKPMPYVGYAGNKNDACEMNKREYLYYSSNSIELNSTVFYNTDQHPGTIAQEGYYNVDGSTVYYINRDGMATEKTTCKKYYIEFSCNSQNQVTATAYKDNSKTEFLSNYPNMLNAQFEGSNEVAYLSVLNVYGIVNVMSNDFKSFSCDLLPARLDSKHTDFEYGNAPTANCADQSSKPVVASAEVLGELGETLTLTASGCAEGKYIWSHNPNIKSGSVQVFLDSERKYSVQCLNETCISEKSDIIVRLKDLTIITDDGKNYVCGNATKVLTFQGCSGSYAWSSSVPGVLSGLNTQSVTVTNLSQTGEFTATCTVTSASGTYNRTQKITLNVHSVPDPVNISSPITSSQNNQLCINTQTDLISTACGTAGSTLHWSHDITNDVRGTMQIAVSPQETTTYYAVCKSQFCSSDRSNEIEISVVKPNTADIIIENAQNNKVCAGTSITLKNTSCSSGETVFWYKGISNSTFIGNGSVLNVTVEGTPQQNIAYYSKCGVNISANSTEVWCYGQQSRYETISIVQPLTVTLTSSQSVICSYETATLTATGCNDGNVEWQKPGETVWSMSGTRSYSTSNEGTYKVRCNLNNNCYNAQHITGSDVQVSFSKIQEPAKPTSLTIVNSTDNTFCEGTQITLSAACQSNQNVKWKSGSNWLSNFTFTPQNSDTYYAFCETTGTKTCITQEDNAASIASRYVSRPAKPVVSASGSNTNTAGVSDICTGDNVSISTSCSNGSPIWEVEINNVILSSTYTTLSNQHETAKYRVMCKDWQCESEWSEAFYLNVHDAPSAPSIASSHSNYVCEGSASVTLTAQGCSGTVIWSNGHEGSTLITSGVQSQNYTAICRSIYGCDGPVSGAVKVEIRTKPAAPALSNSGGDYCDGNTISLSADGGNAVVHWNNYNPDNKPTGGTGPHTFTAYSSLNGCNSDEASITVDVNSTPSKPQISGGLDPACSGSGKLLVVRNCDNDYIKWSDESIYREVNENNQHVRYYHTVGTYTLTVKCISSSGCESPESDTYTFTVKQSPSKPSVSANSNNICGSESIELVSTETCGANGSYDWARNDLGDNNETGIRIGNYARKIQTSTPGYYWLSCTAENGCSSENADGQKIGKTEASIPTVAFENQTCDPPKIIVTGCSGTGYVMAEYGDPSLIMTKRYENGENAGIPAKYTAYCDYGGCTFTGNSQNIGATIINTNPNWQVTNYGTCYDTQTDQNPCSSSYGETKNVNYKSTSPNWGYVRTAKNEIGTYMIYKDSNPCSGSFEDERYCYNYLVRIPGVFKDYTIRYTKCDGTTYYKSGSRLVADDDFWLEGVVEGTLETSSNVTNIRKSAY